MPTRSAASSAAYSRGERTHIEAAQHRRHQFIHFQVTDILTDAGSRASPEGEHAVLHFCSLRVIDFDPPFRPPATGILTPKVLIKMQSPSAAPDVCTAWKNQTTKLNTSSWCDSFQWQACSWMCPQRFIDDSTQIRKFSHIAPSN